MQKWAVYLSLHTSQCGLKTVKVRLGPLPPALLPQTGVACQSQRTTAADDERTRHSFPVQSETDICCFYCYHLKRSNDVKLAFCFSGPGVHAIMSMLVES